jgi:hypothetical protein
LFIAVRQTSFVGQLELHRRWNAADRQPRHRSLQRLPTLNMISIILLLSVVWAMVFKPTL